MFKDAAIKPVSGPASQTITFNNSASGVNSTNNGFNTDNSSNGAGIRTSQYRFTATFSPGFDPTGFIAKSDTQQSGSQSFTTQTLGEKTSSNASTAAWGLMEHRLLLRLELTHPILQQKHVILM